MIIYLKKMFSNSLFFRIQMFLLTLCLDSVKNEAEIYYTIITLSD